MHRLVGRYELVQRLARGGMATVYLGRATGKAGFEKSVAVKVIHPHLADEAQFVGMFLDEARIAARIHHPHVVEILDLGEDEGVYYMVMELVEGENLSALIKSHGEILPLSVSLQIVADALEGLSAAHELHDADGNRFNLVHRDISPHNLLISLAGWVKIADFGIMKAAGKNSTTKTGELRGKLAYMSPEQARGGNIDLRSDLFAIGVVLWELLTGKRLFAARSEAATLERVISCEVAPLDGTNSPALADVPDSFIESINGLLACALNPDAEQRFGSAGAMLEGVRTLARECSDFEEAGPDPRTRLAKLMKEYFAARAEYARAALRAPSPTKPSRHRSSMMGLDSVARRAASVSSFEDTQIRQDAAAQSRPQTGSAPALAVHEGTGSSTTLTTTLPGVRHPVLQWGMWLLLPAIGAGVAIAVMIGSGRADEVADASKTEPSAGVQGDGAIAPGAGNPDEQAEQVTWFLDTVPSGAKVSIAGREQAIVTPVTVEVQRGRKPLDVVFELDGYEAKQVGLPPLEDHTFKPFSLTALTGSEAGAQPGKAAAGTSYLPRTKKRPGKAENDGAKNSGGPEGGSAADEQPTAGKEPPATDTTQGVFEPLPAEFGDDKGSAPSGPVGSNVP
jgi:serine/threonine-protein kinase